MLTSAEITSMQATVEATMPTAIVLCTKTGTPDSGGGSEGITEGATVYGRLYTRTVVQQLGTASGGGLGALVTISAQYIEIPAANTRKVKDLVRIGTLYYEVTSDGLDVDDHTLLSNNYRVSRLDVGVL